jgi:hypothetical protein
VRLVDRPVLRPSHCAVFPFRAEDPDGFVDTGSELPGFDNRVYVSAAAVREMAKLLGFPSPEEHSRVLGELERLRGEVERLEGEVREYDRRFEAIDVLESADFRARRRVGRPRKAA